MDSPHGSCHARLKVCWGGDGQLPAAQPRGSTASGHVVVCLFCHDHLLCRARRPQGKDAFCCMNIELLFMVYYFYSVYCFYSNPQSFVQGSLVNTLKEARPTCFLGVPRVWEKMQEKMKAVGAKASPMRRRVAGWAKSIGLQYNYSVMNRWDSSNDPLLAF